jgi:hypothetical protein
MAYQAETLQSRIDGVEGRIFYQNLLTHQLYIKKYFPPVPGESAIQYSRRPKISIPLAASIIDRIINILNFNTVISVEDKTSQVLLDEMLKPLEYPEFIRNCMVNTLVTGANLTLIRSGDIYPILENWDAPYLNLESSLLSYEYTIRDSNIVPILSDDIAEKDRVRVYIDDKIFGDVEHNLNFKPYVLTKNIDRYDSTVYGKSHVMRYKDLIVEFNHITSQISKAIKILQNVWNTNLSAENPEQPLRLNPDSINFLGPDGKLEQAVRNLNLEEERRYLEILEHQISKSSQVPAELIGLRDAGKLPSGVALQILLQPLNELITRLRPLFKAMVEELTEKVIRMKYAIDLKKAPEKLVIDVQVNENIFPEDRKEKIEEIILLKDKGIIDDLQAKLLIEPYLGIDLTSKGYNAA